MCDDAAQTMTIDPFPGSCGALIHGVDLSQPLAPSQIAGIRRAWLQHQVVAFPDQALAIEDIERFAYYIGPRGEDPFIKGLPGHPHVVEVKRDADEQSKLFAETWHSDWSFLPTPRRALCCMAR